VLVLSWVGGVCGRGGGGGWGYDIPKGCGEWREKGRKWSRIANVETPFEDRNSAVGMEGRREVVHTSEGPSLHWDMVLLIANISPLCLHSSRIR